MLEAPPAPKRAEIWSDVDGVLSADPRHDPAAVVLPWLSYEEAFELAREAPRCSIREAVEPPRAAGIPIFVRNTFAPERPGTTIAAAGDAHASPETAPAIRKVD